MCLLIAKPAGVRIPEDHLRNGFAANDDGAGFAWADGKAVHIRKGFRNVNKLIKQLNVNQDKPAIVHFRLATHGSKGPHNCHPFNAGGGWVMGHNGIISGMSQIGDESDTAAFVRQVVRPVLERSPERLYEMQIREWMKSIIDWSKLAFLNGAGEIVIINEDDGIWDGGIWYSNGGYLPPTPFTSRFVGCGYRVEDEVDYSQESDWYTRRRALIGNRSGMTCQPSRLEVDGRSVCDICGDQKQTKVFDDFDGLEMCVECVGIDSWRHCS